MKKSTSSLISFLLVLCLLLISASARNPPKQKCHPQDQIAMDKIAASFGLNYTGDCCGWRGLVLCSPSTPPYSRVAGLIATGLETAGQISPAVGDLSYLQYLEISGLNITGNIPPTISKLTKLIEILIFSTSISGPIPTFQENVATLTSFELTNNALTGSIPSELPIWFPNLNQLDLNSNKLTGTIPESFATWSTSSSDGIGFETLDLSNNLLTGLIPKSLGILNPSQIKLSRNNFYGDASALFGENMTTEYLDLHGNNFKFDLSNVHFSTGLSEIFLNNNNIYGSIPQELTQLPLLLYFDVSHNKLCGEIPQGGKVQAISSKSFAHNKCLCGAPLPPCVK